MSAPEPHLRELAAFVNQLYALGGYRAASHWAAEAGFPAPNLSEVMSGKAGISGTNLVKLIQAVARRIVADDVAAALQATQQDSLREIVARFEVGLARLHAHLGDPPSAQGHGLDP